MQLLSIWLHLHPAVNTVQSNPFGKEHPPPVFNQSFVDELISRVKILNQERHPDSTQELKVNMTSVRAVSMGFFLTAN